MTRGVRDQFYVEPINSMSKKLEVPLCIVLESGFVWSTAAGRRVIGHLLEAGVLQAPLPDEARAALREVDAFGPGLPLTLNDKGAFFRTQNVDPLDPWRFEKKSITKLNHDCGTFWIWKDLVF